MFLTTNRLKYSWIVAERFLMAFISDVFLIFSVCFLPPSLHSLIHHPFSYAFSYLRNVTLLFQALLPKNIWIHRSFFLRNLFKMRHIEKQHLCKTLKNDIFQTFYVNTLQTFPSKWIFCFSEYNYKLAYSASTWPSPHYWVSKSNFYNTFITFFEHLL